MRLSTSQDCNTTLLYTDWTAARSVGAITSNSLTNSISLIHTLAISDGTATLPLPSIVIVAQLVAQHREVVIQLLHGYLRIDLGRFDVRMSQNAAYALYRHTLAESQGCESMT